MNWSSSWRKTPGIFTGNGELGPYSYFLEAAVSDESVQS